MAINPDFSNFKNYGFCGSGTNPKASFVRYVGILDELGPIPQFRLSQLDHSVSNLSDATFDHSSRCLKEIIRLTQLNRLGSTEVPPNQIW